MTTTELLTDLIDLMTPDNQEHAVAPYAERMNGVEDCLDVLEFFADEDAATITKGWWQALSSWFSALDSFDTAVCGDDPAADAFLRHEAARLMTKRLDVLEAVSEHYAGGHYTDPQRWIDGRGTTYICLSNTVLDCSDATGRALRTIKDLKRRAKVTA